MSCEQSLVDEQMRRGLIEMVEVRQTVPDLQGVRSSELEEAPAKDLTSCLDPHSGSHLVESGLQDDFAIGIAEAGRCVSLQRAELIERLQIWKGLQCWWPS